MIDHMKKDRCRELLELSTQSIKREKVLLMLLEGPKTLEEIRESLKDTSAGVIPQIKKLEKANWVIKKERRYYLTEIGEIIAGTYRPFHRTLKVIAKDEEFWMRHNLTGIPQPLRGRIHELGDYNVFESTPTEIFQPHKEFMKELLASKWVKGVSPIFHPEYMHAFTDLEKKGAEISLIMTKNVLDKIKAEYKDVFKKIIAYKNASMMVCEEEILVAFTVTDRFLSLGLFFKEGVYNTTHDLQSSEKSAIKWGEDLFKYHKERSREITLKDL